jgi:hypothetical protein
MAAALCPEAGWWEEVLEGRAPDVAARDHLETCPRCQQALERLTAADPSWRDAAWRLELQARPVALRRTIDQLKAAPDVGGETAGLDTLPGTGVAFLRPSCDPLHLGRLGPYEVLEVVGRGGMGVVLKALDVNLRRVVAIKVLVPPWANHCAARARFEREARATAAVRHEHVVAVHAVDQADGSPYLVMEYVPGLSLQQRLERAEPLDIEEIVRIGMETAIGLAAAHGQGLIHRDVKPANILLEAPSGRVKLSDFGLARTLDDVSLTQSGVIAGTPLYMSPEQANGTGLDHRADLFSLGSVLYTLCTGTPPFSAPTTVAVLKRVCEAAPRPIREVNRKVPCWLVDIIARLHAKDPANRFASANELARLLGSGLEHVRSPRTVLPPAVPRAAARRSRKWLVLVPVLVGVAIMPLLLCAGVVYSLLNLVPVANGPDGQADKKAAEVPGLQEMAADDATFKEIVLKLDNDDVFSRMDATRRLTTIKPNEQRGDVAQKLAKLTGAEDPFTRQGAVRALGVWATAKEVPALINTLDHSDVFTRREALKVVGRFRDERSLAPVMRGFRDFHTRAEATTALRALGDMAEKDVLALMKEDDVFLKQAAIKVLKDIGTNASVPALEAAVATNNIHLRGPAREALTAIAARARSEA